MSSTVRRYRRRTFLALAGAGAAAACLGSTEAPSPSAEPASPSASSRAGTPTGSLAVYAAIEEATARELLATFAKANAGIRTDLIAFAAMEELETRMRVEQSARKADVLVGGASGYHDALAKDGFLDAYVSPASALVPSALRERAGLWTGWYEDVLGLAVNAARLAKEFRVRPATWDDLVDPAWKGKLVIPDPARTEEGSVFLATQLYRFGRNEMKTLDYLTQVHANVAQYPDDAGQAVAMLARGDAVAAPAWGHDVLADAARMSGVEMLAPSDSGVEIGAVSIVKGTSSSTAARVFVDWLVGRDGQAAIAKLGGRVPTRALAPGPAGAPSLARLDPARFDRRAASDVRGRLLQRWREAVGRT